MDSVDSRFLHECCIIESVDSTGRTNGIISVAVANHVYIDDSLLFVSREILFNLILI